jgi:hypothetical protein
LTVVWFLFFVREQWANSTGISRAVNRIYEIYLAQPVPTGFFPEIPIETDYDLPRRDEMHENFTRRA